METWLFVSKKTMKILIDLCIVTVLLGHLTKML